MKGWSSTILLNAGLFLGLLSAQGDLPSQSPVPAVRTETLFDADWRFHRGGAQGAHEATFDDSTWRRVDLPHDWSIEDLPGTDSPFHPDAITQVSGGFTTGGTGWYRKTFVLPHDQEGRRILIQFDGIYMNAEVWLNGASLGSHPYGYTSFWVDMSTKIKFGTENVLAVKVQNEGENSRWYSGSGIYRHVRLMMLDPVHVAQWGVTLTTPDVSGSFARVRAQTQVVNQSSTPAPVGLVTRILNARGVEVARSRMEQTIAPGGSFEYDQVADVESPDLWSLESPTLYTGVAEVYRDNDLMDRVETKFGIRRITFEIAQGFRLNGETIKLKGGCVHHDNGPLGARAYDRAEERKVELLKSSGYNAIRCSHNPPSPAFLDACDRLGMLVIDEAFDMWDTPKNPHDYHLYFREWWQKDIEAMVRRDRNHPSVIMWSIGNEIPNRDKAEVVALARTVGDFIRALEPTRPITSAVNDLREDKDPYFATLDVAGYNYAVGGDHNKKSLYDLDHTRVPGRIMYCSESYPLEAFGSWMDVLDRPYVIGDFVWTAFDYIGEASIGWRGYMQVRNFYPWTLAFCGDIDLCGWKRPQSFYRDALWKDGHVSLFVKPPHPSFELNPKRESWSKWHFHDVVADWTWKGQENKPFEVSAYSSCEDVELVLNGRSLGRKPTNRSTQFIATWEVPYQPGVLQAIGYSGGRKAGVAELRSAMAPSQVTLQADRTELAADGQDLSYITVELTDTRGVRHPKAENLIRFEIEGPGTIIGVGNANPISTESYQKPQRKAWQGRCLVIVKSGKQAGQITLKATARGMTPGRLRLSSLHGH